VIGRGVSLVLPPLKSTIASLTAAVTGTADRALDPLLDLVAAVPPQPPNPEPKNYIAVLHSDGIIEDVSEPNTQYNLYVYRNKVIEETDGAKSVTIVAAWMKPLLAPGQPSSRILDILESVQRRAYELIMGPPKHGRGPR
jgi:hypothetical protein